AKAALHQPSAAKQASEREVDRGAQMAKDIAYEELEAWVNSFPPRKPRTRTAKDAPAKPSTRNPKTAPSTRTPRARGR
ncbi:MAG: hypothetical protein QHC67_16730, partial [Sphingobium sp.]|uniref:hypothetical protein n=1 Tax=Sphingobium sp. TaxID=1912891 RepID=UPI0029A94779